MPKLDETWDWGELAGTGQHRKVPPRGRSRLRPGRPARPLRSNADSAPESSGPGLSVRLLPLSVVVGLAIALVTVVTIQVTAPTRELGPQGADVPGSVLPSESVPDSVGSTTGGPSATGGPSQAPSLLPVTTSPPIRLSPTTPGSAPATPPPAPPPRPTSAPPTSPPRPGFTPIVVQAEASANVLTSGAQPWLCGPCDGGARVAHIGGAAEVIIPIRIAVAGSRTLTVTYESDGLRLFKVSINGTVVAQRWVTGTGWESPKTFVVTATVPAGSVQITFFNDVGPAPDLDRLDIT